MARLQTPLDTTTAFAGRPATWAARISWTLSTAPIVPRALRTLLRKRLGRSRPGPFDVVVDGIRFRAYPTENRCDRVLVGRGALPEPEEHALLRPFVRPGMVFVDIGANVGTYALWVARQAGPDATILAFEPHPRTYAKLAFNVSANDAANVVLRNVAIAAEHGRMPLFSDGGGNIGHASLLREGAGAVRSDESVAVAPLAAVLAERGIARIDLLKIDVEGFEDRALLPLFEQAGEALWPAAILIETALARLWARDCLAALAARGYRRHAETAENVLLVRPLP